MDTFELDDKLLGPYYTAILICLSRYWEILHLAINDNDYYGWSNKSYSRTDAMKLSRFIADLRDECQKEQPLNKLNRWLGYVQGTMIAWGLTTVDEERNFSRPLFRPLDFPEEV